MNPKKAMLSTKRKLIEVDDEAQALLDVLQSIKEQGLGYKIELRPIEKDLAA